MVCGAKNIAKGDNVPLATVGASLGDFIIEQKKLRGIESSGMLCSEKELGLSDDHSGIFILPENVKIGGKLAEENWINDSVLDINTAPNRGDCLSISVLPGKWQAYSTRKQNCPISNLKKEKKVSLTL